MMKASADLVRDLNAVRLEEEDLFIAITAASDAYANGECHMMTGVITTMQLFITNPDKGKAVAYRLQALGVMMEYDELKNWIRADGAGPASIISKRTLVSAAAEHPLALIDGDILFDKESFLQRVLELAEPSGKEIN
jgi:hypothetical protein